MEERILGKADIERILFRMAHEILEKNGGPAELAIIGIRKGGTNLAERICHNIRQIEGSYPLQGHLDINLYRDDFALQEKIPVVKKTEIEFNIENKKVVLVDDVLYTGRTIRAAMDAIMDLGRPSRIELAVLIDRGLRELPIQADFVGKAITSSPQQNVIVNYEEKGVEDGAILRM
jgi:pyrimidine operon attenuation protein/uracil phosphoribosyltransferase